MGKQVDFWSLDAQKIVGGVKTLADQEDRRVLDRAVEALVRADIALQALPVDVFLQITRSDVVEFEEWQGAHASSVRVHDQVAQLSDLLQTERRRA